MSLTIAQRAKEHIIVVAHRGVSGGNIPCNTIVAYETALKQGADMIEIDLDMTVDGKLVIFHPQMEVPHLGYHGRITELPFEKVKELRYVNFDQAPTQFGIETFDDVLEQFKGRCLINVDKFWGHPAEIYKAIQRHGMTEQMLVKSAPSEAVYDVLEELAPDIAFMPVINQPLDEKFLGRRINYVGAEVLFEHDDSPVATREFIDAMHRDGKFVWVNSIIYYYKRQLSGGHSDDTALTSDMDLGWGYLADHGFDIIQTDWPGMLIDYLKKTNRYFRESLNILPSAN